MPVELTDAQLLNLNKAAPEKQFKEQEHGSRRLQRVTNVRHRAIETVRPATATAAEPYSPSSPSSIPGTHIKVEEENRLLQVILIFTHTCAHVK